MHSKTYIMKTISYSRSPGPLSEDSYCLSPTLLGILRLMCVPPVCLVHMAVSMPSTPKLCCTVFLFYFSSVFADWSVLLYIFHLRAV